MASRAATPEVSKKGKLDAWERARVDEFVEAVKQRKLSVAKGQLARRLRHHVNMQRSQEFYEKLVSRRKLNTLLGPFLAPRTKRSRIAATIAATISANTKAKATPMTTTKAVTLRPDGGSTGQSSPPSLRASSSNSRVSSPRDAPGAAPPAFRLPPAAVKSIVRVAAEEDSESSEDEETRMQKRMKAFAEDASPSTSPTSPSSTSSADAAKPLLQRVACGPASSSIHTAASAKTEAAVLLASLHRATRMA